MIENGRELYWRGRKHCSVVWKLGDVCGASRKKPIILFPLFCYVSIFCLKSSFFSALGVMTEKGRGGGFLAVWEGRWKEDVLD